MRHLTARRDGDELRSVLASPASGIESCVIADLDLAAGGTVTLAPGAERLLLVWSGSVTLAHEDGTEALAVGSHLWLPHGTVEITAIEATRLLEIVLPGERTREAPRRGSLDPAAFSAHTRHAAQGLAFDTQPMADRRTGAGARVFAAAVQPGSGMGLHIHPFDQFYFMLAGRLHFAIGPAEEVAGRGSLVAFPAGTAHRNWNVGPEPVLEIPINVPEPPPNVPGVRHLSLTEH